MTEQENVLSTRIPSWKFVEIEKKVVSLYTEQKIRRVPINPFEIIKKRGYILIPFSEVSGRHCQEYINEESDAFSFYSPEKKTYVIVYNSKKPMYRVRFTLMHELGHIELGHRTESDLARKLADYYAGYALAPSPLIGKCSSADIISVASTFEVSYECADICCYRYYNWRQQGNVLKDYEKDLINLFN